MFREYYLITVWHMAFEDAADVINIKPRPHALLQSHRVTQNDRWWILIWAVFHSVCLENKTIHHSLNEVCNNEAFQ